MAGRNLAGADSRLEGEDIVDFALGAVVDNLAEDVDRIPGVGELKAISMSFTISCQALSGRMGA